MGELIDNLDKLHTTELGIVRIKRNLSLDTDDVVGWCKNKINSVLGDNSNFPSNRQRTRKNEEYYENSGIRKAIALTRYVNVLKNWILYERSEEDV